MKIRKPIPFSFVLENLASSYPITRPMFGCTAVYIDDKIMMVLREREDHVEDNGVWIATTREHHESLKKDLPALRSIQVLGKTPTSWQIIPSDSNDFEESINQICRLIQKGDPRIGRLPTRGKKTQKSGKKSTKKIK